MIGKPEWFTYRILGWGVAPRTWQGWLYTIAMVVIAVFIATLPIDNTTRIAILTAFLIIVVADILHIMTQLDKVHDERERYHQLIIERNCSFAAIFALVSVAIYQSYQNNALAAANKIPFDISILIVLGAMLATKIISVVYVKSRK